MPDNIENSPKSQWPVVQSAVLPDPNILSEISPWDLRFHQLEAGQMRAELSLLAGEYVSVLDFRSNLGLHQLGAGPKGAVTLGIPIAGELPKWRHPDVQKGSLLSFGAGTEFDGVSKGPFHGLTFSMPEDHHNALCDQLGLANLDQARDFGLLSANTNSSRRADLAAFVLRLLQPNGPPLTRQIENEIASELLISVTEHDPSFEDRSTPASRTRARKRAIDVMHALAADAPTISEICALSGASWRTLDRAFLEYFGFGPKAYFKILRLSRVRDDLIANGPDQPIYVAANRWGFWHLSQFSTDYRGFFHELPSETQQRIRHWLH